MRRLRLVMTVAATLAAVLPAAAQRGAVYCNITGITAEQVSNGVKVTISADGDLLGDWDMDRMVQTGQFEVKQMFAGGGMWIEPTEKCTRLCLRFDNARSLLGSCFIPVGKYPVSHVEISIPESAARNDGVGVCVDIVNYQGWVYGEGHLRRYRYDLYYDRTADGRGQVAAWLSDRFPPPPPAKTPEDLPTELTVNATPGGLTVKAVNARLQDVSKEIASELGLSITATCDSDLRVSCNLRDLPLDQTLRAIAMGCGICDLCLPDGSWLLATDASTAGGYAATLTRRLPLRYLRARDAMDLLPGFLMQYLRVDDQANELLITGPPWLSDRVAADLAKLDLPPREVALEVIAVERSSTAALLRRLRLERFSGDRAGGLNSLTGDLSYLLLDELPHGWDTALDYLDSTSQGRIRSRATLRVMSGHTGRISAGQQRNLILEQLEDGYATASVEAVDIGTSLQVTPQLGSGNEMLLDLQFNLDNLSATDPVTGLPIISRRSADSRLRLRNGDTILIAGLQLADQERQERAIPVLSRLPLLGRLFRAPHRARSQTELAVFVTPRLVTSQSADKGEHRSG